jgi:hypothetical protein
MGITDNVRGIRTDITDGYPTLLQVSDDLEFEIVTAMIIADPDGIFIHEESPRNAEKRNRYIAKL